MGRMDGKVVLITGAGRGLGRAHAVRLAGEGAAIVAVDVPASGTIPYGLTTTEDLEATVKEVEAVGGRIIAVEGDVRRQEDLDSAASRGLSEFGAIDVVVANAGVWTVGNFWEIPDEEWRDVFDVNVFGMVRTLRAVTPHMIERGSGSMILTGSINAVEGGRLYAHYIASKHAVLGLMKSVALELGGFGIRCNAILPGVVDTKILDWQGGYDALAGGLGLGGPEHVEPGAKAYALLKDVGILPPSAVSEGVLWLASDDARYVTGQELAVDGGHLILPGLNPANMSL